MQGLQQRANSAAQSPQQPSPQAPTADSPVVQSQTHPDRRVVQRINTDSTPQNPAGPLQQQPSGLALVTAPESMAEHVQANALPATQTHMEAALPSATAANQPELRSHPLLPTPSRKRSFDLSEGTSSIAGSPTSMAAERLAAVNGDGSLGAVDVGEAQEGPQRGSNLLAPVAWAARGAGRLVGTILRRTNSGRR